MLFADDFVGFNFSDSEESLQNLIDVVHSTVISGD